MDLEKFQRECNDWAFRNFGKQSDLVLYGGTCEEAGEMVRGAVKREQGIRGTREEWNAEIRKEIGDVFIKLATICEAEGWDLEEVVYERWSYVSQRDFSGADKTGHGLPEDS